MSDSGASSPSPAAGSPPPRAFAPPPVARRLLDATPIEGARIKERPGDFIVEELPLYEPSGEGEHLYLRIVKEGMSHHEMVDVLCAHFGVDAQAIGTAGMKDRQAVTGQTVSVHLPRKPELRSIQEPRIQVVWATWHGNKLRRGHLAGNRFSIRVRGVEPFRAPAAWRAIRALEARGVPNGFGPQRFGMRSNNHALGRMLLGARHDELLRELCGSGGSAFHESEREARSLFDAGRFEESARAWPRGLDAERAATRSLARGGTARDAVRAVPRPVQELWTDAWQSEVFNRVLDARIAAGTFDRVLPGDVASKHANGARFTVDDAAMAEQGDGSIDARARRLEISATGPLPGCETALASGEPGAIERAAIAECGGEGLVAAGGPGSSRKPPGDRRPLRIALRNPEMESGFDEHGPYVRVAFDLPAGAYATVALREAFGDALADASRDAARS
jgi:tRNA pseudouridine13 synthase